MTFRNRAFQATAFFAAVLSLSTTAQAAEYRGTCYFNSQKMPCSVSQNPFTLTMRWADGVTEMYVRHGSGNSIYYTDERGGIWTPNLNATHGIFLEHKNGNTVGFIENRIRGDSQMTECLFCSAGELRKRAAFA